MCASVEARGRCQVSCGITLRHIPLRQDLSLKLVWQPSSPNDPPIFWCPQHWGCGGTRPHLAFSVCSVNQIQAITLEQANALIQPLVCVYLYECMPHVFGACRDQEAVLDFLAPELHRLYANFIPLYKGLEHPRTLLSTGALSLQQGMAKFN